MLRHRVPAPLAGFLTALSLVFGGAAQAQTCGEDYVIVKGDSLVQIATRAYGKSNNWTVIFYANQDRLGENSSLIIPGLSIRIPCVGKDKALPVEATTQAGSGEPGKIVISREVRKVEFLTADDYAPFTGRDLADGGMATDIVNQALGLVKKESGDKLEFSVSWVNDWSAHLNPLLSTRAFDMGFPWYKPNCQNFAELDKDAKFRCSKFFFSKPIFEEQVLFFVAPDSAIKFEADAEILGKKLCRPTGYWTFDLDDEGRNWVKDNKVVLLRPQAVDECFRMLQDGSVDAVALNELTGRAAVARLGLVDKIRVIDRPIAILSLHVLVAKSHPNARTLVYYVNAGLERLKASGDFDAIVEKHLTSFWEAQSQEEQTKPTEPAKEVEKPAETSESAPKSDGETAPAATGETGTAAAPATDTTVTGSTDKKAAAATAE